MPNWIINHIEYLVYGPKATTCRQKAFKLTCILDMKVLQLAISLRDITLCDLERSGALARGSECSSASSSVDNGASEPQARARVVAGPAHSRRRFLVRLLTPPIQGSRY